MNVNAAKEAVRTYLRSANKTQIARETGISRAWLQKFSTGHLNNPTSARLAFLLDYIGRGGGGSVNHSTTVQQ